MSETLTRATPLILTGLAVAVAFRAKLYNIGAEGQLYAGARSPRSPSAMRDCRLPPIVLFPLIALAAMAAGALLLIGPALLKTRFHIDEVVTTLLLNFIALLFVSMMLDGPMKDPGAMGWPQSVAHSGRARARQARRALARPLGTADCASASRCSSGSIDRFTAFGFEMRAVGANARAARVRRNAGAGGRRQDGAPVGRARRSRGCIEVAGRAGYVTLDMSPGYGYSGIVIAMLAQLESASASWPPPSSSPAFWSGPTA